MVYVRVWVPSPQVGLHALHGDQLPAQSISVGGVAKGRGASFDQCHGVNAATKPISNAQLQRVGAPCRNIGCAGVHDCGQNDCDQYDFGQYDCDEYDCGQFGELQRKWSICQGICPCQYLRSSLYNMQHACLVLLLVVAVLQYSK
jgi:hypothetical protein